MADYNRAPTYPVARKEHRCIYCYGPIFVGERHAHQTGYYDGAPYRNRFHDECFEDCTEEARWSGGEFTPGCADWPERVREAHEARTKMHRIVRSRATENT